MSCLLSGVSEWINSATCAFTNQAVFFRLKWILQITAEEHIMWNCEYRFYMHFSIKTAISSIINHVDTTINQACKRRSTCNHGNFNLCVIFSLPLPHLRVGSFPGIPPSRVLFLARFSMATSSPRFPAAGSLRTLVGNVCSGLVFCARPYSPSLPQWWPAWTNISLSPCAS